MASKTPPRRPRSPPRRLQDRPRHLQEASRRLQDVQDRLQDDSKIAQEASKRLPDASKTAKIASKTPPRLPNRLPNAFLAPKISSKPVKTFSRGLQFPARFMPSPCQVPKYARDFCPQWPSTMADFHIPWLLTKGGLAVVRPRRASSILNPPDHLGESWACSGSRL